MTTKLEDFRAKYQLDDPCWPFVAIALGLSPDPANCSIEELETISAIITAGKEKFLHPEPSIRFIRFACDDYYPGGVLGDAKGYFSTFEEATAEPRGRYDTEMIYDTWTGEEWGCSRDGKWVKD